MLGVLVAIPLAIGLLRRAARRRRRRRWIVTRALVVGTALALALALGLAVRSYFSPSSERDDDYGYR